MARDAAAARYSEALKTLKKRTGMTYREMAEVAGKSIGSIRGYVAGQFVPSVAAREAFAKKAADYGYNDIVQVMRTEPAAAPPVPLTTPATDAEAVGAISSSPMGDATSEAGFIAAALGAWRAASATQRQALTVVLEMVATAR